MRHALLFPALFLLCPPVLAQDIDCATAQVQVELNFCAEQDWQAADADLNEAYQAARSALRGIDESLPKDEQGGEAALKLGQRAWIEFRDQACLAEGYMMHGGSAEPMVIMGCMARLSWTRAEDLWALAGVMSGE